MRPTIYMFSALILLLIGAFLEYLRLLSSEDRITFLVRFRVFAAIGCFIGLIFYYLYQTFTFWSRQGIPNEVQSIYNRFLIPLHEVDLQSVQKYGKVVGLYEGFKPALLIADEKLIAEVLHHRFWKFANHRKFYQEGQLGCRKLVVLEGQEWKTIRSIISPLFTMKSVKIMKNGIDNSVKRLINSLQEATDKSLDQPALVDVKQLCAAFSLEVVAETVFGVQIDSLRSPNDPLVRHLRNFFSRNAGFRALVYLFAPAIARATNLYLLDYRTLVYLHGFIKQLLHARSEELKKQQATVQPLLNNSKSSEPGLSETVKNVSQKQRRRSSRRTQENFISLLLDAEYRDTNDNIRKLNESEIIDNSQLFIIAGFDTTSSTLASILYCLACNPQVQQRLYEELHFFKYGDTRLDSSTSSWNFDTETLNRMEYLAACIWEGMRYIPAVPRIDRRSTENCYLDINGKKVFLPKDTVVIVPTYSVYRNHDLFERPNEYLPERFLRQSQAEFPLGRRASTSERQINVTVGQSLPFVDSMSADPPAYRDVFFPFAFGIRDCIGKIFALMELKTAVSHIILNFELRVAPETQIPLQFFLGQPVLNAKDIKLIFVRRFPPNHTSG